MTHTVGQKGQVVIPKSLRDELGIEPGDEVVFWTEGDHLSLRTHNSIRPLQGRFSGVDLEGELMAGRAEDRRLES